jgi:hypothetical protein
LIRLDKQVKQFKEELFRVSWYMRGGVSAVDLMYLWSYEDRQLMYATIESNIELAKSTGKPFI